MRLTTKIEFKACRLKLCGFLVAESICFYVFLADPFEQIHSKNYNYNFVEQIHFDQIHSSRSIRIIIIIICRANPFEQIHSKNYSCARRRRFFLTSFRADPFEQTHSGNYNYNFVEQIHSSRAIRKIRIEPAAGENILYSNRPIRAKSTRADPFELFNFPYNYYNYNFPYKNYNYNYNFPRAESSFPDSGLKRPILHNSRTYFGRAQIQ